MRTGSASGGVRLAGGRGQSKRTGRGVAVAGDVERVVVLDVRVEPADVHLDGPVGRAGGDHDAGRDDARGVPGPDLGVRTDAGVDPVAREEEEEEDEAVSAVSTPGARRDSGGSVDTVHVTRKVFVEFSASAGSH